MTDAPSSIEREYITTTDLFELYKEHFEISSSDETRVNGFRTTYVKTNLPCMVIHLPDNSVIDWPIAKPPEPSKPDRTTLFDLVSTMCAQGDTITSHIFTERNALSHLNDKQIDDLGSINQEITTQIYKITAECRAATPVEQYFIYTLFSLIRDLVSNIAYMALKHVEKTKTILTYIEIDKNRPPYLL